MELKVLGCHGGESPKHRTSSFLLDGRLAIDAGALTSMLTLQEQQAIEAVVVSHAHMDHVRDLATIADTRAQQGGPPLTVLSTAGTLKVLKQHFFNDKLWPDFSKIPTRENPTVIFQPIEVEQDTPVCGFDVKPVLVEHTVEAAGFIIASGDSAIAYSGDTGPTTRFWEVLEQEPRLKALLMEVAFPNEKAKLARVSGHHTPETLEQELKKLGSRDDLPTLLYHIKPVFEQRVERELARIKAKNISILGLGDQFIL